MNWFRGLESYVREEVPLAPMTYYKVGGPAEFFAEPPHETALAEVLARAAGEGIPVHVLGHGSNLLVADAGVRGLVLRLPKKSFSKLDRVGDWLHVGAGYSLPGLVNWSVGRSLGGLECLVGIPGTVGAALRMNAGGKYGEIGSRVEAVSGCDLDGAPFHLAHSACGFTYRGSALSRRIVTRCVLKLGPVEPDGGSALIRQIIDEKRTSQPLRMRSAGCVFKNPKRPGVPPAGKLIDALGLKGLRMGGASVSALHANFLVCEGSALAADLARLIRHIRRRVFSECGVALELEIAVWGMDPAQLMPAA